MFDRGLSSSFIITILIGTLIYIFIIFVGIHYSMPSALKKFISYYISSAKKLSKSSLPSYPISSVHYSALDWKLHRQSHHSLAHFNVVTFNLLAPCYKRLPKIDIFTGFLSFYDYICYILI